MNIVHLDYEARSGADITEVGSHRFSIDPDFEIIIAAVKRHGEDRVYLWVNPMFRCIDMMGENEEAEKILAEADIVYAHNAPNEQANTWGALKQGKACPFKTMPPFTIWRCTAAMARKAGLPHSLEGVGDALDIATKKDRRGKALINLFCIPDEDTGQFVDPRSKPDDFIAFGDYCITDTLAEEQVGIKLKPFELTGAALETFQFDLRMNHRGIPINVQAAKNAQRIIEVEQAGVSEEFRRLTGLNPTQRKKLKKWLGDQLGLELPNLQAPTIERKVEELEKEVNDSKVCVHVRARLERQLHILGLYQKVSYAAVAKITKMLECVCPDGRVRGGHMYYGAGTGRWSGKLLQPQNFKKTPPWMRPIIKQIYDMICNGADAQTLDWLFGDPLELLSGCIRNFIHLPGFEILDGDFAQVEARIICWLAGQDDVLERWRKGEDLYKWMASHVYGVPIEQVDSDQREVGKRIILGCGFQMGWKKFQSSAWVQYQLRISDEICQRGVKLFRQLCHKIRSYWYQLQNQALDAVRHPGSEFGPFKMRNIAGIPYLMFRLRSGRSLAYPHPKIELEAWVPEKIEKEYGEEHGHSIHDTVDKNWNPVIKSEVQYREQVTYWGQIPGTAHWGRIKLYGGKLAENETQATAADFMSYGAINAEKQGMEPFMLVHDQGLALRTRGQTAEQYEQALGVVPPWARGFPMKVEAKLTPYYTK